MTQPHQDLVRTASGRRCPQAGAPCGDGWPAQHPRASASEITSTSRPRLPHDHRTMISPLAESDRLPKTCRVAAGEISGARRRVIA